ncbi:hypothetical protein M422DRAFT_254948 [Sphaerobolus stellatus SS14]|uniref:Uncharacterized protein n=1 Tax=Sphaerobolus stellatus (strain SS14) TaxID=990650 RepID=A0A0C9VTT9_SPHS4|nr:hypothetical protein M422DRAFT_254948 [Sphaerobolus stellatus SS14]
MEYESGFLPSCMDQLYWVVFREIASIYFGFRLTWLPGNGLADFLDAEFDHDSTVTIVHLAHPRLVVWSRLALVLLIELNISMFSFSEWISRLEGLPSSYSGNPRTNEQSSVKEDVTVKLLREVPALRLLSCFKRSCSRGEMSSDAFDPIFSRQERNQVAKLKGGGRKSVQK